MGCDIHLVLEQRSIIDPAGWIGVHTFPHVDHKSHYAYPNKGRDIGEFFAVPYVKQRHYEFFAALAGVRGEGPEAKGVPPDASELTKNLVEYWAGDGHSHSYLDLLDFTRRYLSVHPKDMGVVAAKRVSGEDDALLAYACSLMGIDTEDPNAYRVVFWFDN